MNKMIDYLASIGEYDLITKAIELLKVEMEDILDAYYNGGEDNCSNGEVGNKMAREYYEKTYITRA